jgi:hypothetical protein
LRILSGKFVIQVDFADEFAKQPDMTILLFVLLLNLCVVSTTALLSLVVVGLGLLGGLKYLIEW